MFSQCSYVIFQVAQKSNGFRVLLVQIKTIYLYFSFLRPSMTFSYKIVQNLRHLTDMYTNLFLWKRCAVFSPTFCSWLQQLIKFLQVTQFYCVFNSVISSYCNSLQGLLLKDLENKVLFCVTLYSVVLQVFTCPRHCLLSAYRRNKTNFIVKKRVLLFLTVIICYLTLDQLEFQRSTFVGFCRFSCDISFDYNN